MTAATLPFFVTLMMTPPLPATAHIEGPAGSLILVEEDHALPLVQVIIAARQGSAGDPKAREGLTNFAAELSRRGAGGRSRTAFEDALDALGASFEIMVDHDSTRIVGQVLARHLDAFLALVADVVQAPQLTDDECERTRRELISQLDEMRTDDAALCGRYFARRLFGDHPYGRAPDGTTTSLAAITRAEVVARAREVWSGGLIFAAAGDVTPDAFARSVRASFNKLPPTTRRKAVAPLPAPRKPQGWRIQLVDKPDRQQVQIMFGHLGLPPTHPDYLPLVVALGSFGGGGMKATLMDEVRSQRGLAYGAYMGLVPHRGAGPIRGWVATGAERAVTTLKLVLRLYGQLKKKGLDDARVAFFRTFLAGSQAAATDAPAQRLAARVAAEIEGLPADWVDTLPDRLRAVTSADVARAIERHIDPANLAITLVTTADVMQKRLLRAKVEPGAIDVVPYDSY